MVFRWYEIPSNSIKAVTYDVGRRELIVRFKNDAVYRYDDVPAHIVAQLMFASSVGGYFHDVIRKGYDYTKLTNQQVADAAKEKVDGSKEEV